MKLTQKVNWKVRFQHGPFLLALFSLLLILAQQVVTAFGYGLTEAFSEQVTGIFNTVLTVLILLGVVTDSTTDGIGDSKQALNYSEPKKDADLQ